MSGRGRVGLVAGAGALVAVVLAAFLLRGGDGGGRAATGPGAERPAIPAEAPPLRPEAPPPAPPSAAGAEVSLPDPEEEDAAAALLAVTALLEDGSPWPDLLFLEMAPAEGGGFEIDLEADPPVAASPEPGAYRLRWKERRSEVVLLVLGGGAECVGAEGAAILAPEERGDVVRFTPGTPATLRFRPLPGRATVRFRGRRPEAPAVETHFPVALLQDGEGRPLDAPRDLVAISLEGSGGGEEDGLLPVFLHLRVPPLPRSERLAGDRRAVAITLPFHEPLVVPVVDLHGEVTLDPVPKRASVTAVLSPAPDPDAPHAVSLGAVGEVGWNQARVRGVVTRSLEPGGALRFYDVPAGEWVLRVLRTTPEGMRWGRRVFRKEEDPVDLGTVEADGWSGLRFRVLDPEGKPDLRASVTLNRVEERDLIGGGTFNLRDRPGPRGGHLTVTGDALWIQPGAGERDPEGWFEIPDLPPATRFRIMTPSDRESSVEAETPPGNGGLAEVELRLRGAADARGEDAKAEER